MAAKYPNESSEKVLDLEIIPQFKKNYISISHCSLEGGFALSPMPVGFDMENAENISIETAVNLSSFDELSQCPSIPMLWVAKEAIYKALWHFRQPASLQQVQVAFGPEVDGVYKLTSPNLEEHCPHKGWGQLHQQGSALWAWFVISRN